MAIGNVELMQKSSPKHLRMRTARMKDDESEKEGKQRSLGNVFMSSPFQDGCYVGYHFL